jgi:transcriptional regulator with XRE-family HTH domain
MTTGQGPTTTRRRLRAELRRLRVDKGMSIEEVTNEVVWSTSKLVRIENGQVGISVSDLNALLAVYGVEDKARRDELRQLAVATRQRTWWARYHRQLPTSLQEFIGAESDATRIWYYNPTIVPGLLQTPAYIKEIIEQTALDALAPEVAKARNEVRLLRQKHVLERAEPPAVTAIIDEAVLRRPVGGPATMREQLDHLIRLAERKTITLVVVPFSAGPYPGLLGAFTLLEYGDPPDDNVLCLETATGSLVLRDEPEMIDQYRRAAGRLEEIGLSESESVGFVAQVREGTH